MRRIFIALMAFGGLGEAGPALAQATSYPFCIRSDDYTGWSGCSFNTFGECQAAASGTQAECLANPWYAPGSNNPPPPVQGAGPFGGNPPIPVGPPPAQ
jgi:hypothetical protein